MSAVVLAAAAAPPAGRAAEPDPTATEYELKAAFLVRVALFVEWPAKAFEGPGSPLVFAVLGENPFDGLLEKSLAGKTIGGRRVELKHFKKAEEIGGCHVLFVARSEKGRLRHISAALRGKSILAVSDIDDFARKVGVIGFVLRENRVRLQINPSAAARAGLQVSAKLLQLAEIVRDEPEEEGK
ncbi:MAG: YfiR family protein [Thermoanaerobaculia bacterium]